MIKNVKYCWGTPDEVSYIDANNNLHEMDFRDNGYVFGIWDGKFACGQYNDGWGIQTSSLMHDEFLPFHIYEYGWDSINYQDIPPFKDVYPDESMDDMNVLPIKYEGEEDKKIVKTVKYTYNDEDELYIGTITYFDGESVDFEEEEYYLQSLDISENIADDIIYGRNANEQEDGSYIITYDDRITYGELMENLGSPDARGRIFLDHDNGWIGFIAFWWDDRLTEEQMKKIIKGWGREVLTFYYVQFNNQKEASLNPLVTFQDFVNGDIDIKTDSNKENKFIDHLGNSQEKWKQTTDFRTIRNDALVQRNKENGWGNATQAEINWWRNKGLDEIIKKEINIFLLKEIRTYEKR